MTDGPIENVIEEAVLPIASAQPQEGFYLRQPGWTFRQGPERNCINGRCRAEFSTAPLPPTA
jgi:hypothetical protein